MKKEIYSFSNSDYTQTILLNTENELFEISTTYDLKYGINRKIIYIGRHEVEAMSKALENIKELMHHEEGPIKADS